MFRACGVKSRVGRSRMRDGVLQASGPGFSHVAWESHRYAEGGAALLVSELQNTLSQYLLRRTKCRLRSYSYGLWYCS